MSEFKVEPMSEEMKEEMNTHDNAMDDSKWKSTALTCVSNTKVNGSWVSKFDFDCIPSGGGLSIVYDKKGGDSTMTTILMKSNIEAIGSIDGEYKGLSIKGECEIEELIEAIKRFDIIR